MFDIWNEGLYSLTAIYDSLSPFMRFCVDMKIEGRTPVYISKVTKKPIKLVYQTIFRAKSRYGKSGFAHFTT